VFEVRRVVAITAGQQGRGGRVPPDALLGGEVGVEGLADQVVREPGAAGCGPEQLRVDGSGERRNQVRGRHVEELGEQRRFDVAAEHGGDGERRGHSGEAGDPGADGLPDPRRHRPVVACAPGEQARHLGHEQRVASRAVGDGRRQLSRRRHPGGTGDERDDLAVVERGQPQRRARRLQRRDHLPDLRIPGGLDRPVGGHEQQRGVAGVAGEELKQPRGRTPGHV
jgi:hypothetical protein